MEIMFVLIPASIFLMGLAMWVFVRAVDDGQFDNLDEHALDILHDLDQQKLGALAKKKELNDEHVDE